MVVAATATCSISLTSRAVGILSCSAPLAIYIAKLINLLTSASSRQTAQAVRYAEGIL